MVISAFGQLIHIQTKFSQLQIWTKQETQTTNKTLIEISMKKLLDQRKRKMLKKKKMKMTMRRKNMMTMVILFQKRRRPHQLSKR
jgi:hypothetical protein